jgi:hypothetical protein
MTTTTTIKCTSSFSLPSFSFSSSRCCLYIC